MAKTQKDLIFELEKMEQSSDQLKMIKRRWEGAVSCSVQANLARLPTNQLRKAILYPTQMLVSLARAIQL